ncbi:MAG: universal stress protein [Schlesneria sp.]
MAVSIRRILFPTDFSEPSAEAQKYALTLADQFGAELHLLHVVVPPVIPFPDSSTSWTMPDVGLTEQVKGAERRFSMEIREWGEERRVVSAVITGLAVEEIVKYAEEHVIDLIVVGTHGLTGLSHLLIGSVAEKLVRVAMCPVLTVRPGGHQFLIEASKVSASSLA